MPTHSPRARHGSLAILSRASAERCLTFKALTSRARTESADGERGVTTEVELNGLVAVRVIRAEAQGIRSRSAVELQRLVPDGKRNSQVSVFE